MNWDSFLNSNLPSTLATILAAFVAFLVYRKQKADTQRDAAKIILQEIRRAEDIISDYKQNGGYQFAKKIIATNSWGKNLHLFVGNLDNDELDKISNLYSTGEYLDSLIKEISDYTFKKEIGEQRAFPVQSMPSMMPTIPQNVPEQSQTMMPTMPQNVPEQSQTMNPSAIQDAKQQQKIKFIKLDPPWKARLDLITFKLDPIYHSTIAGKLKKIARLN